MKSHDRTIDGKASATTAAIQEIHGMGADSLLTTDEEELCEYLVTKYQNQFPLTTDVTDEFHHEYRLLVDTIRQNIVKRKANFFSRPRNTQDRRVNKNVA